MKLNEWMAIRNLKSEEEMRAYFLSNLLCGNLPVAIYSCMYCTEVIDVTVGGKCPICSKEDWYDNYCQSTNNKI